MNAQKSLTVFVDLPISAIDDLIVRQALDNPLWILDAGNSFNPYRLVRPIRRQTPHLNAVLGRIQVARAFTCFQVISLLVQTPNPPGSVFILQLLTTFADELIALSDRLDLLNQVDAQLERLCRNVPVTVTLKSSRMERDPIMEWAARLQKRAGKVCAAERIVDPRLPTLF